MNVQPPGMTSSQESFENRKKQIFTIFDSIKESLKKKTDAATPSQQELLSQLSQLEKLISELVDIVKGNLEEKMALEEQVRCLQEDLADLRKKGQRAGRI